MTSGASTQDHREVGSLPSPRRSRVLELGRHRAAPVVVLGLGMAVQMVLVSVLTDGMWFEGDAWHYLTQRGTVPGESVGWFAPWGGHWQTVPVAMYRALFAVFGMQHYLPYLWLAMLMHLAICGLLYALLVRSGAPRWPALVAVWVALFFGAGSEAYFYDAPLPLTTGLASGLAALLVLDVADARTTRRRVVLAGVLLTVGVMSSGMGLVAIGLVLAHAALGGRLRPAVAAVAGPATLFLVWFVVAGRDGGRIQVHGWQLAQIPRFVWQGFDQSVANAIGLPGGGGVVLVVLVVCSLAAHRVPVALRRLGLTGLAGATVQLVLNALASLTFGVDAAYQSRYQYLLVIQLVPALCVGLEAARRAMAPAQGRHREIPVLVQAAAVGLALLAATVTGIDLQHDQAAQHRKLGALFRAWAVGSLAAVDAGEEVLTPTPSNGFLAHIDITRMSTPQLRSALPAGATARQRLQAESEFFVGVRPDRQYGLYGPTEATLTGLDGDRLQGAGCREYGATSFEPAIELPVEQGVEIGVRSEATQIVTTLTRAGVGSESRTWEVEPGTAYYIASSARGASLEIAFNRGGDYLVCAGG